MATTEAPATVGDALLSEITRVRDRVLPAYLWIGPSGALAAAFMRAELDRATRALAEQDAITCIRSLESLRQFHT